MTVDELADINRNVLKGKTGEEMSQDSPLAEARRLRDDTEKLKAQTEENLSKMDSLKKELEILGANITLGGRTSAGQPLPVREDPKKAAFERGRAVALEMMKKL